MVTKKERIHYDELITRSFTAGLIAGLVAGFMIMMTIVMMFYV